LPLLNSFPFCRRRSLSPRRPLFRRNLFQLNLEQYDGVLAEGAEHKDDAGNHPSLDGGQPLGLRRVGLDRVEDVDQDEKDGDEKCHSTRDDLGVDEERYPGKGEQMCFQENNLFKLIFGIIVKFF
jgi:hypothetical protein